MPEISGELGKDYWGEGVFSHVRARQNIDNRHDKFSPVDKIKHGQ